MLEEPATLTIARDIRRPTDAQIEGFRAASSALVVDAMLGAGALDARISPLVPVTEPVAGPALTAGCGPADIMATLAALNFVEAGAIVVAAFDGFQGCAAAGDRVTGMMKNCGAAGFVTDGPVRDLPGIAATGLPVWCTGLTPASPFTKGPGTVGLPVQIGGQRVETGDMLIADSDGVVVVPFARIDVVLDALREVTAAEAALDAQIAEGLRVPEAVKAMLEAPDTRFVD